MLELTLKKFQEYFIFKSFQVILQVFLSNKNIGYVIFKMFVGIYYSLDSFHIYPHIP